MCVHCDGCSLNEIKKKKLVKVILYSLGYCHNVGGVRTAFCTAFETPIVTVAASDVKGIMVELVPVKNMF